ncbi:MAG: hypothetical protein M3Q69_21605 [Acidobacteriota bacterium]|nr:hypothetical protein [Acidobacteriota bacterium]
MKLPILGTIDERFLMHRQRSTSIAGLTGVALLWVLFMYDLLTHRVIRWDYFGILTTMAVVKMSVLVWYRIND